MYFPLFPLEINNWSRAGVLFIQQADLFIQCCAAAQDTDDVAFLHVYIHVCIRYTEVEIVRSSALHPSVGGAVRNGEAKHAMGSVSV